MYIVHRVGTSRYPVCWTYDLGTILPEGGVANHERGRLKEGIRRDGERGLVGNTWRMVVGILNGL